MADEVRVTDPGAEPIGEAIHLPGPSYLPVVAAAGISIAVIGVVLAWILTILGVLIAVPALVRWIRQTRTDISELPLEH